MWGIKASFEYICKPLTHSVNLSIESGVVPNEMKIARIVPIYKSGPNYLFSNYRPISVLPIFSKFLEKIVSNRIWVFINKNNILFNGQYGFRKKHSTALALLHLVDSISSAIDQKKFTVGIFIDLSKAFDTVNHCILLEKLQHYVFVVWHLIG